jgi:hypothetical protein
MTPPLGWGVLNQSKEHQVAREELFFAYLFPESHLFAYRSRDLLLKKCPVYTLDKTRAISAILGCTAHLVLEAHNSALRPTC